MCLTGNCEECVTNREWAEAEDRANRAEWLMSNWDNPLVRLLYALFGDDDKSKGS